MKKYLILIAGPPATGKTYLVNQIREVQPHLFKITPDELKEDIADSIGFNNLKEKEQLELLVWDSYYDILNAYMRVGHKVILSEYPFSEKQKTRLAVLCEKYTYIPITIRLVSDFDILWKRRYERDRQHDRHLSHLMSAYHYGDSLLNRELADNHISREGFKSIIENRKYNNFQLGKLFEFDVSDFSKVDYTAVLTYISNIKF